MLRFYGGKKPREIRDVIVISKRVWFPRGGDVSSQRSMPPPRIDVLVVEDDGLMSALLVEGLHTLSLSTDVAGTVVEAKRLLARMDYAVVVLDLLLVDGTGFDVLDFMRTERLPTMQVVVVTAAEPALLEQLDRSRVKTVLFKPVDVQALAGYVRLLARNESR